MGESILTATQWVALAALVLAGCAPAVPQSANDDALIDAQRIALPDPAAPAAAPIGKPQWTEAGGAARFGISGAEPQLELTCRAGRLVVTRPIAAEPGASALFAIEGPKRIVRLAVDAVARPDRQGYIWQGSMAGNDRSTDVFAGRFTGTLPGGGLITVSAGDPPRAIVRRCAESQGTAANSSPAGGGGSPQG